MFERSPRMLSPQIALKWRGEPKQMTLGRKDEQKVTAHLVFFGGGGRKRGEEEEGGGSAVCYVAFPMWNSPSSFVTYFKAGFHQNLVLKFRNRQLLASSSKI